MRCDWLGEDESGLFQQYKWETERWDPGLWLRGGGGGVAPLLHLTVTMFKQHCRWSISRSSGNDECTRVRDKEVIRMIPRFWSGDSLVHSLGTRRRHAWCKTWGWEGDSQPEMSYRHRSELRSIIWAADSHLGELAYLCLVHGSGWKQQLEREHYVESEHCASK